MNQTTHRAFDKNSSQTWIGLCSFRKDSSILVLFLAKLYSVMYQEAFEEKTLLVILYSFWDGIN
jgi:hypothetical protein